jgi:hypothetical protein
VPLIFREGSPCSLMLFSSLFVEPQGSKSRLVQPYQIVIFYTSGNQKVIK